MGCQEKRGSLAGNCLFSCQKIKQFEFHGGISATAQKLAVNFLYPSAIPTFVLIKQTDLASNAQSDVIMKKGISLKGSISF